MLIRFARPTTRFQASKLWTRHVLMRPKGKLDSIWLNINLTTFFAREKGDSQDGNFIKTQEQEDSRSERAQQPESNQNS